MRLVNLISTIFISTLLTEKAISFDYFSSKRDIPVVIKTSPEPNRPIPPSISEGTVIWLTDLLNKGFKNPKASLDKKTNRLFVSWDFGSPCRWYLFPKTFPILAVFKDKNGLEVGSYFSKRADYAPAKYIAEQLKKNGKIADFTFKDSTALKSNDNSYEFTLKQTEADAVTTVELGFNTYETVPKGAIESTTKDFCK